MFTSGALFACLVLFTNSLKDGKNKIPRNSSRLFTHESILQWIPSITDTIGTQHLVRYSEVSQTRASGIFLVGVVLRNQAVEYNVAAFSVHSFVVHWQGRLRG